MDYLPTSSPCNSGSNSAEWIPRIASGPDVIVSKDAFVADGIDEILPANNNVGAAFYRGALYMGWRSAPTHFATDRLYDPSAWLRICVACV